MKAFIRFITVPTADTPGTALYLHFDERRYLVGQIGEGTQRACVQNGIALKKVQDVFITGKSDSHSMGGLIGMMLTLADVVAGAKEAEAEAKKQKKPNNGKQANGAEARKAGKRNSLTESSEDLFLSIYGPQNLTHSLATARKFVFRKGMPIKVHEIKSGELVGNKEEWLPTFVDEYVKVWAMPITPVEGEKEANGQPVSPRNPRKRSFDQANALEDASGNMPLESDIQRQEQYDQITKGVVGDMFGSKWRMDTLVATPLDEVKLPAKLWIRNLETKDLEDYTGPLPGGSEPLPDPIPTIYVRKPWPGALITSLPPTSPNKTSVSYIIVCHPKRGKFDIAAAQKLNIPHRALYSKLTNGESVINADGLTITPDMVMAPDEPGNGVAVIDLPSLEYVEPLIKRDEWNAREVTEHVGAVIWILGPNVAASPLLRQFMEKMSHMKHLISSPDHCPNQLTMDGAASSAIQLAQIDMAHFPIPNHDNKALPQTSFRATQQPVKALPESVKAAQRGQIVQLEPTLVLQNDSVIPPLDTISIIREGNSSEIMDLARTSREALEEPDKAKRIEEWISQLPMPDVEITTLGTGSALPSKHRNVSATLVRVPGYGSYLLDAGENTLGQLQRVFNPTELEGVLKDLRMIWISHLHADHHLGTVPVIKAWHHVVHGEKSTVPPVSPALLEDLQRKPSEETKPDEGPKYLAVVSDFNMLTYLWEYSSVEDYGYEHVLPLEISSVDTSTKETSKLKLVHKSSIGTDIPFSLYPALLGIHNIQSVYVNHCHGAKAVAITFPFVDSSIGNSKVPFKLSYSGDCRPSKMFADIGINSTVLIHEATFEDELVGEARAKKHSTVSEALGVGSLMRAKSVVLTHFSQRYSKIPVLEGFWGDRSKVEEAIKGANEVQERLAGIEAFEDDVILGGDEGETLTSFDSVLPAGEKTTTDRDEAVGDVLSASLEPVARETLAEQRDSTTKEPDSMKVLVAFDYMRVKLRDIPKMEALRPALAKLYEKDIGSETTKLVLKDKKEKKAAMEEKKSLSMGRQDKTRGKNSKAGKKFAAAEERRALVEEEKEKEKEKVEG